jgi:lipoprotein-anchoring transpeptidase ErfK/SrfK
MYAFQQAQKALRKGDRRTARRWAERAADLDPSQEEPWLIMAALASPRASLEYLKHVLEINPQSIPARKGMHWAIQRYRTAPKPALFSRASSRIPKNTPQRRSTLYPLVVIILALLAGAIVWFGTPSFSNAADPAPNLLVLAERWTGRIDNTATTTFTPFPTFTSSPTATNTASVIPTDTATPIPTATSVPQSVAPRKDKDEDEEEDVPNVRLPTGVEKGEIWIDVDLTNQQVRVYKGKNLLNTFIASTGTWRTPTVSGQYRVYVKYVAADMAGPGYYLPSVPYVMYFYKGYSIHGTYWHNNFGTPMSHGCVNLRTNDAEWVYNRASVGTMVNIHY